MSAMPPADACPLKNVGGIVQRTGVTAEYPIAASVKHARANNDSGWSAAPPIPTQIAKNATIKCHLRSLKRCELSIHGMVVSAPIVDRMAAAIETSACELVLAVDFGDE